MRRQNLAEKFIFRGTRLLIVTFVGLFAAIQSGSAQGPESASQASEKSIKPNTVSVEQDSSGRSSQSFEVASVRQSPSGTPYRSNVPLFGTEDWKSDYLRADAIFMVYVSFAYDITDSVQGRAVWDKLPGWAKSDFFHIEAKAENVSTRDQMRVMMQSLLTDRFKLAVHRETVQRETLILTLKKPGHFGPQFREHPADQKCVSDPNRPPVIPAPSDEAGAPRYCGMVKWSRDGQEHIQIVDATMLEIANYLASASMREGTITPHAGNDATGLNGRYDLDLQFAPSNDRGDVVGGPTFLGALQKQAGFTLTQQKIPMQLIVIDHLERPTPN